MHDPKFEQEVQQKMHDLEFIPSDSVWAGIRQGIAPRERRRRVAVIWWLFPGVLLLTGGIVMYRHSVSPNAVVKAAPAGGIGGEQVTARGAANGKVPNENNVNEKVTNEPVANRHLPNENRTNERMVNDRTVDRSTTEGSVADGSLADDGYVAVAGGEHEAGATRRASWEWYQPGLIGGMGSRRGVAGPPLDLRPVNTAVSGIRKSRHPWMAGFAAGGGGASIHSAAENALVTLPAMYATYGNSALSSAALPLAPRQMTLANVVSGGSKQVKSAVKVDYSYWAGIYGEKELSARWSVDIGLNLHYYSVRLETNSPANNFYAPSSASLFTATSITYTPGSSGAYSGGGSETYYNRYYFLEAPVTAQFRLNRSRVLPLFWRGGAVFSYLMSSNGLYYNYASGSFQKDNGVVRRTQAGLNSGLMVGLPLKGVQIQAGPEVQYALTNMLTTGSGGGHMVYGGLRVALMP